MQESSIMEIVKWFIGLLIIGTIVAVVIFGFELGSVNNFKQQVNYQIERQGGLTPTAIANINEYSKKYNRGMFTVESDKLNEKVEYGEAVDYVVNGTFEIKVFAFLPDVQLQFEGTGVSRVRWQGGKSLLENNTSRMFMFIGGALVLGGVITYVLGGFDEIESLIEQFMSYRLQKY